MVTFRDFLFSNCESNCLDRKDLLSVQMIEAKFKKSIIENPDDLSGVNELLNREIRISSCINVLSLLSESLLEIERTNFREFITIKMSEQNISIQKMSSLINISRTRIGKICDLSKEIKIDYPVGERMIKNVKLSSKELDFAYALLLRDSGRIENEDEIGE